MSWDSSNGVMNWEGRANYDLNYNFVIIMSSSDETDDGDVVVPVIPEAGPVLIIKEKDLEPPLSPAHRRATHPRHGRRRKFSTFSSVSYTGPST
jgi:hypothetical protein